MKRSILALLLLFALAISSKAQMQKGSWMLDGQVGLTFSDEDNESINSSWGTYINSNHGNQFSLTPGLGYFFRDNLVLGVSPVFTVGWSKGQSGQNDPIKSNSFGYGIGLFSRKYIPMGEKVSFFGDLRIEGVWGNSGWRETGDDDRTVLSRSRGFQGTAGVGIQYLIADFLGLHLQSPLVSFHKRKVTLEDFDGNYSHKSLSARLFTSFQIGATVFF